MRRLPVFFVLDCSESMVGQNLQNMEQGVQMVMQQLRKDPYALETVYISIIAFAGIVRTLVPLVEVFAFYPVPLPLGGGTNLGKALEHLMDEFDRQLIKTTEDVKGDWKPIVYLFTDGRPTDRCEDAIYRWQKRYARRCTLIALGMGKNVEYAVLKKLTEHTIAFEELNETDFKKFFMWISASVLSQSKSVGDSGRQDALPPLDERFMHLVKDVQPNQTVDEQCVTFVGRCGKLNRPYLMKFEREIQYQAPKDLDINLNLFHFQFTECCKISENYFTWSDQSQHQQHVNTTLLQGSPQCCPHCYAETAFAMCGCGNLMCYDGFSEVVPCPWCRRQVRFGYSDQDGFDVQRGRG